MRIVRWCMKDLCFEFDVEPMNGPNGLSMVTTTESRSKFIHGDNNGISRSKFIHGNKNACTNEKESNR